MLLSVTYVSMWCNCVSRLCGRVAVMIARCRTLSTKSCLTYNTVSRLLTYLLIVHCCKARGDEIVACWIDSITECQWLFIKLRWPSNDLGIHDLKSLVILSHCSLVVLTCGWRGWAWNLPCVVCLCVSWGAVCLNCARVIANNDTCCRVLSCGSLSVSAAQCVWCNWALH